jgi:hypothetical protein
MTNGPPNPGPALSAVRAAQDALNAAILLTAQRQNQLTTDINAARELLSEATNAEQALRGAAPATAEMTATGIEKSAAALKGNCDLLRAVDAGKRAVDYTSRDALALRVARHGGKKAVEVATAWRRAHRRGRQEHDEK